MTYDLASNRSSFHSYRRISPSSSNSTKRAFEDDPTFAPPSLSSYSAGLDARSKTYLTASTSTTAVTGIYEMDFPNKKMTSVQSKLAAHFGSHHHHQSAGGTNTDLAPSAAQSSFTRSSSDMDGRSSPVPDSLSVSRKIDDSVRSRRKRGFKRKIGSPKHASQVEQENVDGGSFERRKAESMSIRNACEMVDEDEISRKVEERRLERERLKEQQLEQEKLLQREREREQEKLLQLQLQREREREREREHEAKEREEKDINFMPNLYQDRLNRETNSGQSGKPVISPLRSPFERKRIPLSDVSPNVFRKPKLPRSAQKQSPRLQPLQPKPAQPLLEQRPPSTASEDDSMGANRKRNVNINGKLYEKLELLGKGGSSKVYRIKATDGRQYAMKKVTLNQFEDVSGFKGEIDLLLKMRHSKRVVKLIDHAISTSSIYLIMEKGDIDLAIVFQNRQNAKLPLDIHFVKYHIHEMFKCVEDVHDAGIVHSDLKPANFIMVKGMLKIIDFGIANAVPDHTVNIYRESQIGTPNYMAPEALVEANLAGMKSTTWKVGRPSDVWSCGCILYQFIYGKPPYAAYSGTQRVMAIMNPQIKIQFPAHGIGEVKVPASAIQLMKNCLARDPSDRWTIDQCLSSDFFNPKVVNEAFIGKLVHQSINLGFNKRIQGDGMSTDEYDSMIESMIQQIEAYNC
ncbi:uncharacterized protein LODBEIA_P19260 [Lodderomyces beijingensis]|uniref:Protein kinase domain-containing protein n=1 Tax=Lodderomyces beijingensis TaxID=1775926 RepID=A0ABP0ZJV1_9ASCO